MLTPRSYSCVPASRPVNGPLTPTPRCSASSSEFLSPKFPYISMVPVSSSWRSSSLAWQVLVVTQTHTHTAYTHILCYPGYFGKIGCVRTPRASNPVQPTVERRFKWKDRVSRAQYCNRCKASEVHLHISKLHSVNLTLLGPIFPSRKRTAMLQLLLMVEKSCSLEWEDKLREF